eukprot:PRCOL_00004611-RA
MMWFRLRMRARFRGPNARLISAAAAAGSGENMSDNNITGAVIEGMKVKITEALEAQSVEIQDAYGDNQHVSIDVVSTMFEGKNSVQRQRLVYKAIWQEMQETVHAVDAMTCKTPEEAGK